MFLQPNILYFLTSHFILEFPCYVEDSVDLEYDYLLNLNDTSLNETDVEVESFMYVGNGVTTFWHHNDTLDNEDIDIVYYNCPNIDWRETLEDMECPLVDDYLVRWLVGVYDLQCSNRYGWSSYLWLHS